MSLTDVIKKPLFSVGRLIKVHGVHGALILRLHQPADDLIAEPEWMFILIDGGPVPFENDPEEYFLKDSSHLVIKLIGYDVRETIHRFIDNEVLMEGEWDDWFIGDRDEDTGMIGFTVIVEGMEHSGTVAGYLDIPGNPLVEVAIDGKEVLVPDRPEFIIKLDPPSKKIWIRIPEGLMDL